MVLPRHYQVVIVQATAAKEAVSRLYEHGLQIIPDNHDEEYTGVLLGKWLGKPSETISGHRLLLRGP